jgi:transcription initiation factor TFIIB
MGSALGVPDPFRQVAATICRRAVDESLIRGWSVESVATAALYAACRERGTPRSLDELTAVSRVGRRDVGRTYKHLVRELGLELEPPHPRQYVARICSDLGLPESTRRRAREIIDVTADAGLVAGKSPTGYAGAAVFVAALLAGHDCRRTRVADAADVTPTTVRSHARAQLEAVGTETVARGLLDDDAELSAGWRQEVAVSPDTDSSRELDECC